ncbi:hypothetical protein Ddc_22869 [Ditylenchus destructor]|nr:hypothetical protein Ddc_22869 [Ditylenchus destructor]
MIVTLALNISQRFRNAARAMLRSAYNSDKPSLGNQLLRRLLASKMGCMTPCTFNPKQSSSPALASQVQLSQVKLSSRMQSLALANQPATSHKHRLGESCEKLLLVVCKIYCTFSC